MLLIPVRFPGGHAIEAQRYSLPLARMHISNAAGTGAPL